jgi:hypothetical protein
MMAKRALLIAATCCGCQQIFGIPGNVQHASADAGPSTADAPLASADAPRSTADAARADANPAPVDAGGIGDAYVVPSGAFVDCATAAQCGSGMDCVPIGYDLGPGSPISRCLPRCGVTGACPTDTYCYPPNGGNLGNPFAPMANHCYYSMCGAKYGNGSINDGMCRLGAEAGIAAATQLPGQCFSTDDTAMAGACEQTGPVAAGGVCTSDADSLCAAGLVCLDLMGTGVTKCIPACNPTLTPTGCVAPDICLDFSITSLKADGTVAGGTQGFCVQGFTPCTLGTVGVCGGAMYCSPTNGYHTDGICQPPGGTATEGANCDPSTQQCASDLFCDATTSRCEKICVIGGTTCTGGKSCKPTGFYYGPAVPPVPTIQWGTCQ